MSQITDAYHDFFVATASVIGALVGLLFVAITVSQSRAAAGAIGHRHRVRAAAAFTAFSNVLTTCLFGLVPDISFGETATAIGGAGLACVAAAALKLRKYTISWALVQDTAYLVGLVTIFAFEITVGIHLQHSPTSTEALPQLATLLVVCSLLGIARAWDLVEAPGVGLTAEVTDLGRDIAHKVRHHQHTPDGHPEPTRTD